MQPVFLILLMFYLLLMAILVLGASRVRIPRQPGF